MAGPATAATVATAAMAATTAAASSAPAHLVTGYWQNFVNGATVLKLRDVPPGYNLVAVAFASATATPGGVAFQLDAADLGYGGDAEFISDIAVLHAQGRKVVLSVGGADGTITVSDSAAAGVFASSVLGLMNQYGFDGVDIDLEHGITPAALSLGLRAIATARPGVLITMAPGTYDMSVTTTDYFQLALSIKDILTVVNVQYYDSGTTAGCDGNIYAEGNVDFLTALACTELENGLRPDQVGIGTPATPAAGSGYVPSAVVLAALACLQTGNACGIFHPPTLWPGIRGAMTWSVNWDATNGYQWVDPIAAVLAPSTPCTANSTTLCIDHQPGDSRFAITAAFTSAAQSGSATPIPLKSLGIAQGGLFWFFAPGNPELLVKILDGCAVNNRFWLFAAADTNVAFTLQLLDTQTGNFTTYTNPPNTAAPPIQDTSALPCTASN